MKTPENIRDGDVFGQLTVVKFIGRDSAYRAKFEVSCNCGSLTTVLGSNLKKGNTSHCNSGIHRQKHGAIRSPEYAAWKSMNWRCNPKNSALAHHYSDRGITVCSEWAKSFQAFFDHIGSMPSPGMEVDRIDNDGNYQPGNVRWATRKAQMRNTRTNRIISINGEHKPLAQWAEESGLSVGAIVWRVKRKWPESEILSARRWKHRVGRCA